MKSVLHYFNSTSKSAQKDDKKDVCLPNPYGPLNSKVPPGAIEIANKKVAEIVAPPTADLEPTSSARKYYIKLMPAQIFTVGKRAAEHGTTAAMRYYSYNYSNQFASLKKTIVRRLKNQYLEQVSHNKNSQQGESIQELPLKKNGRPLMLGKLDQQVREYIRDLRAQGIVINTAVVLGAAEGIIMHKDANLLSSCHLTEGWAKYLLRRMGFVKRKETTKANRSVEDFEEVKRKYLQDMQLVISMDEIPDDLVINFDQTGIHYIPVSDWTMAEEGAKRIEIAGKDNKRQITAVFAGSMGGEFLLPQLVYEEKTTTCCLPHYSFPSGWHVTYSANHWSNEDTMNEYLEHIILPYIRNKRAQLKLADNYPALLTFDNFKAQYTIPILTLLDQNNINVVLICLNSTDRLQPLDLSVNKSAKSFL